MHMVPLNYEEFSSYGEMIYEISKRILLEKVRLIIFNIFLKDYISFYLLLYDSN